MTSLTFGLLCFSSLVTIIDPFAAAPLDLVGRSRVVAAGSDALCAELAHALSA